jgi:MFS family permease
MPVFIAARALQGFGMGLVIVAIYVVVAHSYPDAMRPRVFSYLAGAWVVPSMVGPALAGWLAAAVSWRWAFLGVLPLVVPAMALVLPALTGHPEPPQREREPAPASRRQSRVVAAVAVAAGTAVLQYAGQRLDLVALPLAVAARRCWRTPRRGCCPTAPCGPDAACRRAC